MYPLVNPFILKSNGKRLKTSIYKFSGVSDSIQKIVYIPMNPFQVTATPSIFLNSKGNLVTPQLNGYKKLIWMSLSIKQLKSTILFYIQSQNFKYFQKVWTWTIIIRIWVLTFKFTISGDKSLIFSHLQSSHTLNFFK